MSSDDFGTVNLKPERAREIEVMRQHYRRHRETLGELAANAPTDYLAGEYQRLIREVDMSLGKLDELEGRVSATPAAAAAPVVPPRTEPGRRTLNPPPAVVPHDDDTASPASRLVLILIAGLLVLGALGWLIWRASSDERPSTPIVSESAESTAGETDTIAPAAPQTADAVDLSIEPPVHDFGIVRKGTRAARQYEVVNTTDAPISIKVSRSNCRCLYYDYADVVPPRGRETLTVTVDGAKAEVGQLQETVTVTSNADASVTSNFNVTATIR